MASMRPDHRQIHRPLRCLRIRRHALSRERHAALLIAHLLPLLRRLERRRLALVGGVRGDNPRAIHFYEKFGFAKVGEFQSRDVVSFDMIAEL